MIGCLVNAGATALWLIQIEAHRAYLTHLLPAELPGGAGVGLTIPRCSAWAASHSPRTGPVPEAES